MKFKLIEDLEKYIEDKYSINIAVEADMCPADFDGDITINCFRFAKKLKANPMQVAKELTEYLSSLEDAQDVECVKAFINVTMSPTAVYRDTVADSAKMLGETKLPASDCKHILIEYSAPNTNKPQHLGHVRNNILGMSLVSLLRRVGHNVSAVNLINDRGIHICKSMLAYQMFGEGCTPESTGIKGDHLVGKFYVKFNDVLKTQLKELRDNDSSKAELSDTELSIETEVGRQAQDMLIAWENADEEVRKLWARMNKWVIDGFNETYKRFGVEFDKLYLESQTYNLGKDIISDGLERGVFYKREDGPIEIDLTDKKLDKKVLLRSDGTSVYITQDIGTTVLKYKDSAADTQIWVVGNEQVYHFNVLFEVLKRLGYDWADNLYHLAYGMVNLPSGRMKSREGTVVDADDLFEEMVNLADSAIRERCAADLPEDIAERSEIIGLGALKFMLLKVNPKTTIMFDPNASIKFEGDTGPYVQYAYARISSILRKAAVKLNESDIDWSLLSDASEKKLALCCAQYAASLKNSAEKLDCSGLVEYLLGLAKSFSRFYANCPVLAAPNEELKKSRLHLCSIVREILGDGLKTLTIGTMESM